MRRYEGEAKRPPFLADERGAIMVIGVFMAACLVGCIFYMFGLGEAMVYRQQTRAAADATVFDAAVVHAVGMNVISMLNIAMAVALSILLALQIVFLIGIILTVISALVLLIPFVDILDVEVFEGLLNFDSKMLQTIEKVQPWVFSTIATINITEAVEAIVMPWVANAEARDVPDRDYGRAAQSNPELWQPFSWSMIPNRLPFFSNLGEQKVGDWMSGNKSPLNPLLKRLPILKNFTAADLKDKAGISVNPAKALTSRYGLPVQDDKYAVLCDHAGVELVDEFSVLLGLITAPFTGSLDGPDLSGFGFWFGAFVGQFPGIFCSGVDPMQAINSQLASSFPGGIGSASTLIKVAGKLTGHGKWSKTFKGLSDGAKKVSAGGKFDPSTGKMASGGPWYSYTMFPMKTYDLYQNGNGFGQVWAIIKGHENLTTGARMGTEVAKLFSGTRSAEADFNKTDFAEAEFYYDCGGSSGPSVGRGDASGSWDDCKYNAMWNMRWKARLRRYHPFQMNLAKMLELAMYNALGAESFVQYWVGKIPFTDGNGILVKWGLSDSIKSCLTSVGQGKSGKWKPGACPIPMGGPADGGNIDSGTPIIGGLVGWNSDVDGIDDYEGEVFH